MISVGKYAAAAKGGRNVASDVSVAASTKTSAGTGRMSAEAARASTAMRTAGARNAGSGAGYMGGRSTYIRMNGTGYGPRARGGMATIGGVSHFDPGSLRPFTSVTDYSRLQYHGLRADGDLSRLL